MFPTSAGECEPDAFIEQPGALGRSPLRRLGMGHPTGWEPPPLPDDPKERRKIGVQLVILAVLGLLAMILSAMMAHAA